MLLKLFESPIEMRSSDPSNVKEPLVLLQETPLAYVPLPTPPAFDKGYNVVPPAG